MDLLINGEKTSVTDVTTLSDLISKLEINGKIAVEINREIIPQSTFPRHALANGDEIEIVTAIGGGQTPGI